MRANKTRTRIGWIMAMALSGASVAQEVHPVLAKGKVIEEAEHDLDGAAKLYAQVAHDGSLGPVVRADAFLRLAKVHQRQGDYAAMRTALENAAHGKGPAADEAQRLLDAPQEVQDGDRSVDLEILRLMTIVRDQQATERAMAALDEIAWFGERAVPLLAEAVRTEKDFGLVSYYAQGLLKIGGPKVLAWIEEATKYEDPLRRRAVVRGHGTGRTRVDARQLAAFLEDPAAEVRLQAVESIVLVDWEQALARLRDEDARVREATLGWLGGNTSVDSQLPAADRRGAACIGLIAELDARAEVGPMGSRILGRIAEGARMIDDPAQRIAVALALACAMNVEIANTSSFAMLGDGLVPATGSNVLVDELLGAARTLRGVRPDDRNMRRILLFHQARDAVVRTWDRASREAAFELVALGVGLDVDWFGRRLEPRDWITLFERLGTFEDVPGYSREFLTRQLDAAIAVDLPAEAFGPLRGWFEAKAALLETDSMWLHRALVRLGKLGTEESARWSVRMLTGGLAALPATGHSAETLRFYRDGLFMGLIAAESPSTVQALRELAVAEGAEHAAVRNMALSRLAWLHDVEAAPSFARAYELGIERTPMLVAWGAGSGGTYNLVGLGWIERPYVRSTAGSQPWPGTDSWTDAEQARAIDPCLALGIAQPWEDARDMIASAEGNSAVFEVACRHWSTCPDAKLRERFFKELAAGADAAPERLVRQLVIDALRDPSSEIRSDALGRVRSAPSRAEPVKWTDELAQAVIGCLEFEDQRIAYDALRTLGDSGDPKVEEVLVRYLGHESSYLRRGAVSALFALVPDRALDLTFDTLRDPALRTTMNGVARQTLDRRFVPLLIDALRDEVEIVRERAKEALDAIEFFVSQEQRWKRLLSDAGLESGNAAEALLKQARTATDKRVRLAAIQSLGTLAVPETLPFLIQLMQDDDAEVAAAATAAIERINNR